MIGPQLPPPPTPLEWRLASAPPLFSYEKLLKQYVIDASDAKQDDALGHSAFAQNADILKALGNTFLAKPEPGRGGLLSVGVLNNLAVAKVVP
jgi:hypothetical protein